MACKIEIETAKGTSLPQQSKASTITIGGSAEDCTEVNVSMNCGGDSASKVASVGFNGSWAVTFDTSALGCTCGQNFAVSAYCVGNPNCFRETTFDLECTSCPEVTGITFILKLDPPTATCVNGKTRVAVTLMATGNSPGAGKYEWDFDDGSTATTNVPFVDHQFEFPDLSYNVKVDYTPAQAGCPPSDAVATLTVPDCDDVIPPPKKPGRAVTPPTDIHPHTDVDHTPKDGGGDGDGGDGGDGGGGGGGGGKLSCDALLVIAISLLLAGGLTIVIGVCSKVYWVGVAGGVIAALGVALFGVWYAICGTITSCDVMRKMHASLRMIVLLGLPLAAIGGGLQALGAMALDPLCWGAIAGYYGSIAWLKDRLESIMWDAGCAPTAKF